MALAPRILTQSLGADRVSCRYACVHIQCHSRISNFLLFCEFASVVRHL